MLLTLQSYASLKTQPSNKASHFVVDLDTILRLENDSYEVCLSEIHYDNFFRKGSQGNVVGAQHVSIRPPDDLYIYCTICEPSVIGDSMGRLLRVIPTKTKFSRVYSVFLRPYFVPVQSSEIRSIEIMIADRDAKTVEFSRNTHGESASTIVVLEIRPVRRNYST